MSRGEVLAAVRAAISNAYYDARNAGRTMEDAADAAAVAALDAARVMRCVLYVPHYPHDGCPGIASHHPGGECDTGLPGCRCGRWPTRVNTPEVEQP